MIMSRPVPPTGFVAWNYRQARRVPDRPFLWGNLLVGISAQPPVEGGLVAPIVTAEHYWPAMQGPRPASYLGPLSVTSEPAPQNTEHGLIFGQLDSAGTRYLMWQAYTGGAHCCFHIQLIIPEGPQRGVLDLGMFDMEMMRRPPIDVDGDGRVDFVMRDDRFLYAFASYAASFAPPRILNIESGRVVDVSAAARYRRLFEEAASEARPLCLDRGSGDRNGACAAFVAASARTGNFEAAWREMLGGYERDSGYDFPQGCRAAAADACPAGQEITYPDFPTALRAFLLRAGYLAS
jgi:hypothetical protein